MRLRARVTLAVVTVTVVTLLIASVTTVFLVWRDELADLDRALLAQARLAARLASLGDPRHPVLESGLAEVPEHYEPSPQYIAIYDPKGEVLAATASFRGLAPPLRTLVPGRARDTRAVDLDVLGEPLRGVVLRTRSGNFVLYAASRREVDSDVAFLTRLLAILLGSATIATSLVALWLGRRLSSDVQDIARVAREVANGNLRARIGSRVQGSRETIELAADLDHMVQQLAQLVIAQQTFISHAAHELMSPLTSLRGELQLALRRPRTAEDYAELITQSLADVNELILLAKDLLALARLESAVTEVRDAAVSEVVAGALRAAKGGADARGVRIIEIDANPGARALHVKGATRELSRALRNLVDNAVAHSEPGMEVRVVLSAQGAEARVAVEDTGPGVPASDRAHVFEPFFRGARERGEIERGVGLGLSIARQIARRCGGDLELDESFTPGARFVLTLRAQA